MPKNSKVLVLNADYSPHSVTDWQRAIILSLIYQENPEMGAQPVVYYGDDYVRGASGKDYMLPAVIRCMDYITIEKGIPFSKKNVFIRDKMRCQYCGNKFPADKLTYDHVIPRIKWKNQNHSKSPTQWGNIVTCCVPCNRKKANKTPQEARMTLIKQPAQPNPYGYILGLTPWSKVPTEWWEYLTPLYQEILKDGV